jgi:hypothetical protein
MNVVRGLIAMALTVAAVDACAADAYKIVDTGDLGEYWNFETKMPWPSFPHSSIWKRVNVCVAIGFSVESDGRADNVSILRVNSSNNDPKEIESMKKSMIEGVSAWRFVPAETNTMRAPLYTCTITSMSYVAQGTMPGVRERHAKEVSAACVIPDFLDKAARGEIGPRSLKIVSR